MADGVQLSRQLAEVLKEMAKKYLAHGWPTQFDQQTRFYPPDSIIFVNRSGEEMPPYACMQVTGTLESDGRTIFEVSKPDAATLISDNQLLFNSARAVADDENGSAQHPAIVKAIKDSAETTDEIGEGWSYTDGEWYLSPTGGSFVYYGTSDIDDDVIVVKCPSGGSSVKYAYPPSGGIPAATYNSAARKLTPGTASCRLAELVNGEYCDTGVYVVVENPVGTIVGSSGKPITVGLTGYGKWTVLVEDCSGESAPVEPTAMTPDPGESSGSRALDPGYKIGV